jgi:hypothetical protein
MGPRVLINGIWYKQSIKGWERSRRADRNLAVATIALMVFFLVAGFTGWMLGTPGAAARICPGVSPDESPNA